MGRLVEKLDRCLYPTSLVFDKVFYRVIEGSSIGDDDFFIWHIVNRPEDIPVGVWACVSSYIHHFRSN